MTLQLPKIIAHRGAKFVTPENTLPAFERAAQLGATWVEFDVQIMACGTLIVHHDDSFQRILNLNQPVADTPYDEIKDLDAGSWFAPQFDDVRIPTLQQVLHCCSDLGLAVNIELKTHDATAVANAQATLALLATFEHFKTNNTLITSSNVLALQTVQAQSPDALLGFINGDWQTVEAITQSDLNLFSMSIHHGVLTPARTQQLLAQHYAVMCYTINDFDQAQMLFDWGVNCLFSDDPLLLD